MNRFATTTLVALTLLCAAAPAVHAQTFAQQGPKLVEAGGGGDQGSSVAISGDGNTAVVGGPYNGSYIGAAWVWTRAGGVWAQDGPKLVGSGVVAGSSATQGDAVAISADGSTVLVGGGEDNFNAGAVWAWTKVGGAWTQQGPKLVGSGAAPGFVEQGRAVALSADGNTAVVGGPSDDGGRGALWVWTRSAGVWTQEGSKLVAGDSGAGSLQGLSVALSTDGNTAIVGGNGAAWVWVRTGGVWAQQGPALVVTGVAAVAVSGDGATALIGAASDAGGAGSVSGWTQSGGVWTLTGYLVAVDAVGSAGHGSSVSISADGQTAWVGARGDNGNLGSARIFSNDETGTWSQQGASLYGVDAVAVPTPPRFGTSVALSGDGTTAIAGGPGDSTDGAAWVVVAVPPPPPPTGQISTIVTASGGAPLAGVRVDIYDGSGTSVDSGTTDAGGVFGSAPLPVGGYRIRTSGTAGYLDELFDNVLCEAACDLLSGTMVSVTGGNTTPIAIALAPSSAISGTVRDGVSSAALPGVQVQVYKNTGEPVATVITDGAGHYEATGLPSDLYVARTVNGGGYVDELYNNISCALGCAVTSGTVISTTAGQTFTANFSLLPPGGGIAGTITDAATGAPLPGVTVNLFDTSGSPVTSAITNTEGQYLTGDVPTGSYHARTTNALGYLDELFDDLPCAVGCAVTSGTVITHTLGTTGGFADFGLSPGNVISGSVATAEGPLPNATVTIHAADGAPVVSVTTDGSGQYASPALPTAFYFARTGNAAGYADELFDDIACAVGCVVTSGTPISATLGSGTSAINFVLVPNTPTGANVNALAQAPSGEQVLVTYGDVTAAGLTTVTTSPTGPAIPAGFQLGSPAVFYDLSTTATFTPSAQVCLSFANVTYPDPSALRLLHFEGGVWADVTTSLNLVTSTICGTVTSFSPFVIAEQDQLPQSIVFNQPTLQQTGNPPVTLVAFASSGLPVSFQVLSGPGTVIGTQLTITGGGNIVVRATQGGSAQYLPAPAVDRTVIVNRPPVAQNSAITTSKNTPVMGTVTATDPDSDSLTFAGSGATAHGSVVVAGGGSYTYAPAPGYSGADSFAFTVSDGRGGAATGTVSITVTSTNAPPVCSLAAPSQATIWPPNHRMVPITIQGVTDPNGDAATVKITSVFSDEPTNGSGDGNTAIDASGIGTSTAVIRAERSGNRNGRVYYIRFTATDPSGARCKGEVRVAVPRNPGTPAIGDGAKYNAIRRSGRGDDEDEHHGCSDRDDHDRRGGRDKADHDRKFHSRGHDKSDDRSRK